MPKKLIITSGDISDADGFLALAEYSLNTNADILFIMNYPAFLRFDIRAENTETDYYKGFNYGLGKFLERMKTNDPEYYKLFFSEDVNDDINKQKFIYWLSKITAYFCLKIFREIKEKASHENKNGNLYFMIGGINKYNPFNYINIKNEFMVYKELILSTDKTKINDEIEKILGDLVIESIEFITIYDMYSINIDLNKYKYIYTLNSSESSKQFKTDFSDYGNIYIDGNGSISFLESVNNLFTSDNQKIIQDRLSGFYVMGGVLADIEAYTISIIPTVIHRPALATMNQYYSPNEFVKFIYYLFPNRNNDNKKLVFVSNHSILEDDNLINNLSYLILKSELLKALCNCYYIISKGAKKPFDLMTAKILIRDFNNNISTDRELIQENISSLIYSKQYGITLLYSKSKSNVMLIRSDLKQQLKSLPAFNVEKETMNCEKLIKTKNITIEDIKKYIDFKKQENQLLITEGTTDTQIFNCYIATLDNPSPNYIQGKDGKYTYSQDTKVIIKSYDDIIRSYGKEPTNLLSGSRGGSFRRKIRKLKSYIKSKNRIFK